MANETMQTSCGQEYHEVDECRENIPPGVTAAGKLKVQGGDSSTQPSGEFEPLSDTCTFSTPAPTSSNGGVKTKSRLSGLQSALTPILKYLNIGNKCPSPEPLKDGSSPRLTVPFFPPGNTTTDCQQSTGGSSQPPNSDSSRSHSGRLGDINASVCWLNDEYLPEITLLDVTSDATMQLTRNDSALPDSVPATPVTAGSVKSTFNTLQPSQLSSSLQISSGSTISGEASATTQNDTLNAKSLSKQNGTITVSETSSGDKPSPPAMVCNAKGNHSQLSKHNETTSKDPNAKMVDIPESIDAPLRWLDDRYFPEITLLDVTRDSESSPGVEISFMEVTRDVSLVDGLQSGVPSSELSGQIEPGTLDTIESVDLSSTLDGNATHTISSSGEQFAEKSVGENVPKVPLEVTRDISTGSVLEDSQPSTSAEDTLGTHPANVTHDITSSSDMSVQCAASQFSTSDMQCSTNSKNVTSELPDEPVVTTNTVEVNNEALLSSHDAELTSKVPQPSSKPAGSVNGTFTIAEQSNLSTSTNLNTTPQIPCPQNKTLDLAPSNVNSPKVESDARDLASSVSNNATEASPVVSGDSCDVQNVTFDKHSLQKSSGNSVLGQAGAATFCLQNNTFDTKSPSKQNGTITVSETSSSDSHQNTSDKPSPAKVCNATSTPKDNNSEVHPLELSKHNGTTASTDTHAKMEGTPESTFEVNPAVEVASGDGRRESKDHSQSGLPMRCGLSDTPGHQSMDTEDDKAYTLNLDDTLDLRADALITSTPMTNCKMFNFYDEQQERKTIGAQKKLYGDGPSKPDGQAASDVPSNIVCDRKTFLTQTAAKSALPPLKLASQLLKYKPASILPGRFELLTSGLPMTRQRTQAEALRNSDASQATAGISTSYNLRATTTGSKQSNSGMRKPQLSGIPSGIQRAAAGLRLPSAKSHAPASSSTDKLRGPTATHPATKILQAKKHPLTRGEALPIAKRKKMDAPLPPGGAEASTSSCDAATRAKNLKRPATSQRALPAKTPRDDVAVPASTAETSASCSAVSRVRALKQPVTSNRALPPKPQSHGCAKCIALEQQLEMKSEEIRRLKEELLKYSKPEEEC